MFSPYFQYIHLLIRTIIESFEFIFSASPLYDISDKTPEDYTVRVSTKIDIYDYIEEGLWCHDYIRQRHLASR